jgi:hypothetical protein
MNKLRAYVDSGFRDCGATVVATAAEFCSATNAERREITTFPLESAWNTSNSASATRINRFLACSYRYDRREEKTPPGHHYFR